MMPDDYYKYKLRGVIIHEGTAESGHYYSLVNPKGSNQWLEVNDIHVKDFDVSLLPQYSFGGEDKFSDEIEIKDNKGI